MTTIGIALLVVGALIHAWYGGNSKLGILEAPDLLVRYRGRILGVIIVLLLLGLALIGTGASPFSALAAAAAYFFVAPLVTVPFLRSIGLIPRR